MKIAGLPVYVYLLVALALFAMPPEIREDPRLWVPMLALDIGGLLWLVHDIQRYRRELTAQLDELEKQYGPGIYEAVLHAYREVKKGGGVCRTSNRNN